MQQDLKKQSITSSKWPQEQPPIDKKPFLHWAGKPQFCLRFDKIEANLCPKKVGIGPKKTWSTSLQKPCVPIGQNIPVLLSSKQHCLLIGPSRRYLRHQISSSCLLLRQQPTVERQQPSLYRHACACASNNRSHYPSRHNAPLAE